MFQNVLFYALSDDIKSARKKLLIEDNKVFDIFFLGMEILVHQVVNAEVKINKNIKLA